MTEAKKCDSERGAPSPQPHSARPSSRWVMSDSQTHTPANIIIASEQIDIQTASDATPTHPPAAAHDAAAPADRGDAPPMSSQAASSSGSDGGLPHSASNGDEAVRKPLLHNRTSEIAAEGIYASGGSSPPVSAAYAIDIGSDGPLLQSTNWIWNGARAGSQQSSETTLTRDGLQLTVGSKVTHLPLDDIVGVVRGGKQNHKLLVHSYPRKQGCCSSNKDTIGAARKHVLTKLSLDVGADPSLLDLWLTTLQSLLAQPWLQSSTVDVAQGDVQRPRRLLLLINPASGTGNAARNLAELEPMLVHSGLPYTILATTHANHAFEIANRMDPRAADSPTDVVCVSGDGLVHEVVNGLMQRADWAAVTRQIRVGHIGGGSGNGLASAVCAGAGEAISSRASAFLLLKGWSRPFDLFSLKQQGETLRYGFLSMGYGMISDIDLESESMRYLGNARFTVSAINRIFNIRRYQIDIEYLPDGEHHHHFAQVQPQAPLELTKCAPVEDGCAACGIAPSGAVAAAEEAAGAAGPDAARQAGRVALQQYLDELAAAPAAAADEAVAVAAASSSPAASSSAASSSSASPAPSAADSVSGDAGANPVALGGGGWHKLSDAYCLVWILNATHAASDMHVAPTAHFSDGCIELYTIRHISRLSVLSLFLNLEKGTHMSNPHIQRLRVRALRLVPRDERVSQLTCDGERLPYKPVEVRVFRGVLNLLAR